jgi:ankyrin repeat protein
MDEKRKEQLRVKDMDYDIGFWLRGTPYVWVPGETVEECRRYYLFHGENENYFLHLESKIKVAPLPGINIKNVKPLNTKPLIPNFSLFPLDISDPDCQMVRNCFLVWVYNMSIFEVGEPRMEGLRLSSWRSTKIPDVFTIINPKTKYKKQIQLKSLVPPLSKEEEENMATGLLRASKNGDLERAKEIISKAKSRGLDIVNVEDIVGVVPLYLAVENGKLEVAELLISNGADVNKESEGVTPLISATINGDLKLIELLISNGADVNKGRSIFWGGTPLQFAVHKGYLEIMKILISHGADVNKEDGVVGFTPLHYALISSEELSTITGVDQPDQHPRVEIVQELISHGADVNTRDSGGRSALDMASESGFYENVRQLVFNGADINKKNPDDGANTALGYAIDSPSEPDKMKIVKFLISEGAEYDIQNLLHKVANRGNLELLKYFVSLGGDVNKKIGNMYLLNIASTYCGEGSLEVVEYLVSKAEKAEVDILNYMSDDNPPPLWNALECENDVIAEYLIFKGADYSKIMEDYEKISLWRYKADRLNKIIMKVAEEKLKGIPTLY